MTFSSPLGPTDALALLDAVLLGRQAPPGVRLCADAGRWVDEPAWPPANEATPGSCTRAAGSAVPHPAARALPADPADPTPTVGGTQVGPPAGAKDNRRVEAEADVLTFTTASRVDDVHPRFGHDPGTGEPLATGHGLRASEHEIFHDPQHASVLWLPLAPGAS